MPRKKSPANCEPNDPMLAITPATINATCGVWFVGCTFDIALGKIPSSAHANINLETDKSIAGKSFMSAIAAPKTMATPSHDGRT